MGPCWDSSLPSTLTTARNEHLVCAHSEQWEDFSPFKMISHSRSFCLLIAHFLPLPVLSGRESFGGTMHDAVTSGRGTCVLPRWPDSTVPGQRGREDRKEGRAGVVSWCFSKFPCVLKRWFGSLNPVGKLGILCSRRDEITEQNSREKRVETI